MHLLESNIQFWKSLSRIEKVENSISDSLMDFFNFRFAVNCDINGVTYSEHRLLASKLTLDELVKKYRYLVENYYNEVEFKDKTLINIYRDEIYNRFYIPSKYYSAIKIYRFLKLKINLTTIIIDKSKIIKRLLKCAFMHIGDNGGCEDSKRNDHFIMYYFFSSKHSLKCLIINNYLKQ